ncbi:hypothetical protein BUALT_Bualt08G0019400 [Buddleja alternifolia]|uniref:MRN complex-interacting protein N-terminal domain-containing protein n=1 Tax=Buddleja alternifolia TaxID=168488 RepID=A0AAV6XDP2_9LAMI|nr:hypothetical protein BUALT_Bualt08G0019400 [Buddleja alternifolia]
MPPTTFIAVQCFQCSTMQAIYPSLSLSVKQQKKSSSKWSCVVCNQKQSLRHVFAKGFVAKDVRKFVQNFNMSRQLSDQKQLLEEEPTESLSPSINEQKKKQKRNDWTEYVDEKDEYCGKFNEDEKRVGGENGLEPIVVTEMPKALFKKPKLKDYYSSSSSGYEDKLLKPVFQNRRNAKSHKDGQSQDILLTEIEQTPCERASKRALDICSHETPTVLNPLDRDSKWNRFREVIQENNNNIAIKKESFVQRSMERVDRAISNWSDYITQDEENYKNGSPTVPLHQIKATNGPVSKWSSFVTEEDDDYDLESKGRKESLDRVISQRRKDAFESLVNDERVEDDIHPDFL